MVPRLTKRSKTGNNLDAAASQSGGVDGLTLKRRTIPTEF